MSKEHVCRSQSKSKDQSFIFRFQRPFYHGENYTARSLYNPDSIYMSYKLKGIGVITATESVIFSMPTLHTSKAHDHTTIPHWPIDKTQGHLRASPKR